MKKYIGIVKFHNRQPDQVVVLQADELEYAVREVVLQAYGNEFGRDGCKTVTDLERRLQSRFSSRTPPCDRLKYNFDDFHLEPFFSNIREITVSEVSREEVFPAQGFEKGILRQVKAQTDEEARQERLKQYHNLKEEFEGAGEGR